MLPIDLTTEPAPVTDAATGGAGAAGLGQQDFLNMLIAQLENQDPLNPQDATEFTAQLAQFSSLEQLISMRAAIDELTAAQSKVKAFEGIGLIGREVLVEGSQFEIDANGSLPELSFELNQVTNVRGISIRDSQGVEVARTDPLGEKPPGLIEIDWEVHFGADFELEPGAYSFRIEADFDGREPATTFVVDRVTGTSDSGGESILMLGDVVIPLSQVREVRE